MPKAIPHAAVRDPWKVEAALVLVSHPVVPGWLGDSCRPGDTICPFLSGLPSRPPLPCSVLSRTPQQVCAPGLPWISVWLTSSRSLLQCHLSSGSPGRAETSEAAASSARPECLSPRFPLRPALFFSRHPSPSTRLCTCPLPSRGQDSVFVEPC